MAKKQSVTDMLAVENIKPYAIPEAAFFLALYYFQYLMQVKANLILSSIVLFVLINVAVFTCPLMKSCCK